MKLNIREDLSGLDGSVKIRRTVYLRKEKTLFMEIESEKVIDYEKIDHMEKKYLRGFYGLRRFSIRPRYRRDRKTAEIMDLYEENLRYIIAKVCPSTKHLRKSIDILYADEEEEVRIVIRDSILYHRLLEKNISFALKNRMEEEWGLPLKFSLALEEDQSKNERRRDLKDQVTQKLVVEITPTGEGSSSHSKITENKKSGWDKNKKEPAAKAKYRKKEKIEKLVEIGSLEGNDYGITVKGRVFSAEEKELRSGKKLLIFGLSDRSGAIFCKMFLAEDQQMKLKEGKFLKVFGDSVYDSFLRETVIMAKETEETEAPAPKTDDFPTKRVELHAHTNMSAMDGIASVFDLVRTAKEYGHKAVAVTDHGVVQAFPDAMEASKKYGVKVIYGVEGYLVDDMEKAVSIEGEVKFADEFVVFDIETTGFSNRSDEITEIGAVKIRKGEIVDKFSSLVNPKRPIPFKVQELTGITEEMVRDEKTIEEVLPGFLEFVGEAVMVAHNSSFDMGFIRAKSERLGLSFVNSDIDTLTLSRLLLPELKRHKLNLIAAHMGIRLENHHRAVDDAAATAEIFLRFIGLMKEKGMESFGDLNRPFEHIDYKSYPMYHIILLAKDQTGLKNLYKLVSKSHLDYFYRKPRLPRSEILSHREGLLIGSACEAGELYQAVLRGKAENKLDEIASFYDYIEVMPVSNNAFMVEKQEVESEEELRAINRRLIALAKKNGRLPVATGDVHFLKEEDAIYRSILQNALGFKEAEEESPLYFKTTGEMMEEFSYLGEELAYEIVVENTGRINEMIEEVQPVPDGTFPPVIEGSDEELRTMCYKKARSIYGEELPEIVEKRLERELNSIISNGYAVMYIIAQKLVAKSLEDGYLVGSRGSVGSSFAAAMSDITEVNPLCPHYICDDCKISEFITDGSVGCGADLPDKSCPSCGKDFRKEGHDIPFEVFLGFEGDKEPDIDLNFAGEYQPNAHKYTEDLFGEGRVYRAGTIGTLADKTAFGFVKKYAEEKELEFKNADISCLKSGCIGVKRTSGQHPGGVMVVPAYKEIYDFTPIQYPANDPSSGVVTTHFDYHSISGRILKLDILGHDAPTIIRMLEDITGVEATRIPLDDKETMSLFTSTEALGCNLDEIGCVVGSLAVPEFGTKFVRQMLIDTRPTTFGELVRISGLSHGTLVWVGNAQDLVRNGAVELKDVISTRDDIMNYLIQKQLKPKTAFKIMENVRKGKGLTEEMEAAMKENQVPDWYIDSCKKIQYMFPKAHAAAYVMMSFRIAYFKVFHKEAFYATYFTMKAEDFDLELIAKGKGAIVSKLRELDKLGNDATAKEKNMYTILEVAYEMYQRGVELENLDLYRSDPKKFIVTEERKILPPLIAVQGLGETVACNIASEAKSEFISIEDFRKRTKVTKTVIETLISLGCLKDLSETNQLSFL
ncbi:MAG: PolC-type DNA polymerase III [Peptostreptococcaceae bacterium]|nr:PolC-type DNA polymerase III [Peptostreptococcaceae bacterium]